jgi:hypothetical protein
VTKPFTDADLSGQLALDRTWRVRELSDLKTAILKADEIGKRVLLRALVTICYAHWEGYVRFAARKYLEHVALRKLTYSELDRQFLRNLFLPRLAALSRSKGSVAERCDLIDQVLNASDKRFSQVNEDLVNTQSNLNFGVFSDICLVCGIPVDPYNDRQTFIDVMLLKRRNAIAHGEDTFVEAKDLRLLIDTTVELMRTFGDELENRAALKTYRAVARIGAAVPSGV